MYASKLTSMGQNYMKPHSEGRPALAKLPEMTKDPMKTNTEPLIRIPDDNEDTGYGRRYESFDIHSIEEYQANVPVTMFDGYAGFTYSMAEGGATNPIAPHKVGKGLLERLSIRPFQLETYPLHGDISISNDAASAQLKPPHIPTSELQRRFFLALLEEIR